MVRRACIAQCLCVATALVQAVHADEDEAWLGRASLAPGTVPLLTLVIDTSEAMSATVEVLPPFDPARDYVSGSASSCRPDRIYWRIGAGPPPGCDSPAWVSRDAAPSGQGWQCAAGQAALDSTGIFVAARAAQWEPRGVGGFWRALRPGDDGSVECVEDRGRHGGVPGAWFAVDGAAGPWSATVDQEPRWHAPPLGDAYVFYTGNFLAYLQSAERITSSRYDWLVRRASQAARSTAALDLALARFSYDGLGGDDDARGGMIALAPTRLPAGVGAMEALLDAWLPAGPAPVAEALSEVLRWLGGQPVSFGDTASQAPGLPLPSAPGSRSATDPLQYATPFDQACRPAMTVVATAGRASADAGAADAVRALPTLASPDCSSACAAALARSITDGDLVPFLAGRQRSAFRWLLPADADPVLREAAAAGGSLPRELDAPWALVDVVAEALQNDAAEPGATRISAAGLESRPFVTPDSAVYFALSSPRPAASWRGNLRRFRIAASADPLQQTVPIGRNDDPAFDPDGRLTAAAWSEWSAAPDGNDPAHGGAAALLPAWSQRRIFSDLADAPLVDPANRVSADNVLLTRDRLGLAAGSTSERAALVEWLLGRDAFDDDLDGDLMEDRRRLGDAGLRAPGVLRYGPEGPALAFMATDEGMLHAFDADTGIERWVFAPSALLPSTAGRAERGVRFARRHGLDGPVTIAFHERVPDGHLASRDGDRALLFVGLGRGGTGYYGLDVSDPAAPRLAWRLLEADLPGFAQSWPAPVPAKMWFDPSIQGDDPRVLVLAGGHDPLEDANTSPPTSHGAALVIVAAATGRILWRAGRLEDAQADLRSASLVRSLPAAPRLLDTDGDGLHDRAYVVDAGGQLLRLDFVATATGTPSARLQRIADLGSEPGRIPGRRFQATPDVVLQDRAGRRGFAIAFGSGWVSRPRSLGTVDRFYVVFDPEAGSGAPAIVEADLDDVSDAPFEVPPQSPGWLLRLDRHGAGEKVTGSSMTFDHRLRFTTYQPLPPARDAPCGPPAGIARLYTLDVRDGRPLNRIGDEPVRDEELVLDGIAPALEVAFPVAAPTPACGGTACRRLPQGLIGGWGVALDFRNDPVRTSWRQLDADAE